MCSKNQKNNYAKNFDVPLFVLSVKVYSGQNCVINSFGGQKIYVEMELRGNKKD